MKRADWKALAAIVVFYGILEAVGITCPIKYLTGVSCPGCGMSRAWFALLRLDLSAAWACHPLFWLPVPAAGLLLRRERIPGAAYRWSTGLICGLFLVAYVVRLLAPQNTLVVFQPREGLFWRLFRTLFQA